MFCWSVLEQDGKLPRAASLTVSVDETEMLKCKWEETQTGLKAENTPFLLTSQRVNETSLWSPQGHTMNNSKRHRGGDEGGQSDILQEWYHTTLWDVSHYTELYWFTIILYSQVIFNIDKKIDRIWMKIKTVWILSDIKSNPTLTCLIQKAETCDDLHSFEETRLSLS